MATAKKGGAKGAGAKSAAAKQGGQDHWSQHVTETSDAMDLEHDVFKGSDPEEIARSLKASAEHSDRRKSDPFRAAMSMLTFYINRAGHNLEPAQHRHLEDAKHALRALFDREDDDGVDAVAKKAPSKRASTARKAAPKKAPAKKAAAKKASGKSAPGKKAVAKKAARKVAKKVVAKPAKR